MRLEDAILQCGSNYLTFHFADDSAVKSYINPERLLLGIVYVKKYCFAVALKVAASLSEREVEE